MKAKTITNLFITTTILAILAAAAPANARLGSNSTSVYTRRQLASSQYDILFIGNSYSSYNDLPLAVEKVFQSAGLSAQTKELTADSKRLSVHAYDSESFIRSWSSTHGSKAGKYVVLQEQSQIPGFSSSDTNFKSSIDSVVRINRLVDDAGQGRTLLFNTWGYLHGDEVNPSLYPNFKEMQSRLDAGYQMYRNACRRDRPNHSTEIVPVGRAYELLYDAYIREGLSPTQQGSLFHRLYISDGSHPSPLGTELSAYVFFSTITGIRPTGLASPYGTGHDDASVLQAAATAAVFS